jgi:CheY-like chemotaxis protein
LQAQGKGFQPIERGFHVLVVDDNKDAADSLRRLLRIWGYQSEACCDAKTGLRAACELHPDCLIVDIDMPDLVGLRLAREVRTHPGLNPVMLVALTANSNETQVQRLRGAGFDFLLTKTTKPSEIERLINMISKVVRYTRNSEQMDRQNVKESKNEVREIREARTVGYQGDSASYAGVPDGEDRVCSAPRPPAESR